MRTTFAVCCLVFLVLYGFLLVLRLRMLAIQQREDTLRERVAEEGA
jgi:hypothetical protein